MPVVNRSTKTACSPKRSVLELAPESSEIVRSHHLSFELRPGAY
jgi:hypothetical protein